MTRLLALAAFLFATLQATPATAQEDWTGPWNGTLNVPSVSALRLVIHISRSADDTLTAQMESPDQGPGRFPIPQFAIADGRMTFAIPALSASYEGTFTQGMVLPLNLVRGGVAANLGVDQGAPPDAPMTRILPW